MLRFLALELCETESILRTFKIAYIILTITKIVVPLLIIILGMTDLAKVIMSGKDDEIKKSTTILIKRVIAGLVVFMIPSILDFIFNLNAQYQETVSEFAGCTTCLTNDKQCDNLIEVAKAREKENRDADAEAHSLTEAELKAWAEKSTKSDPSKQNKKDNNNNNQSTQGNQNRETVGAGKYFDPNDVTKISGLSEQEFINVLQNSTAYKGKAKVYLPYAKDLIAAEKNHGVNAFYLIGLYSYESGWLGSKLTKTCNNIGGVRYYNQTYSGNKKTTNCWNRYAGFDSISEFIDFHATLLETKYLTPGASHYHGTGVADVAKDYGSGHGIDTIIQIANYVSTK